MYYHTRQIATRIPAYDDVKYSWVGNNTWISKEPHYVRCDTCGIKRTLSTCAPGQLPFGWKATGTNNDGDELHVCGECAEKEG